MLDRIKVDELAGTAVLKTRTEVIVTNRFYGTLVSNVEPALSRAFPTAATNGKRHYFNPDFVAKLNAKQLHFVQRHESEHDARHHSTRRGNRDPKEWNICTDFAINIDLVDEIARTNGKYMEVPPEEVLGGPIYCDAKYRGMSAEDIYRCRELDRQRAEQEKQKQEQQESQESEQSQDSENADTDPGKDAGDETSDETDSDAGDETGEGAGDDAGEDEGDEDGEAGNGGAGDEADEDETADGESGDDGEGEADGEGQGEGQGSDEGEASEPKSVTGDMPGGLGEVLDATDDPAEASDEEAKWERVVRQAASIGKGDTPGHIRREIERANQPKQDWREVLRTYFDGGATRMETWNRPNRRFVGSGTILPGSQREGLNTVCVLIDTSGSVDDVALACVAAETQAALDEHIIDRLVVISGDVGVNHVTEHVPGDEIDFNFEGRGGTAMRPLFDYVRENVDNPSLIICATDGFIEGEEELGAEPEGQVLWAYHGYPQYVQKHLERTPWNAPGIDIGQH